MLADNAGAHPVARATLPQVTVLRRSQIPAKRRYEIVNDILEELGSAAQDEVVLSTLVKIVSFDL